MFESRPPPGNWQSALRDSTGYWRNDLTVAAGRLPVIRITGVNSNQ
jgi:hypothetical protein